MGFEPQMKQLVGNLSSNRQSLLFSATLPEEIIRLANEFLRDPVRVTVGAVTKPIEKIRQDVIKVTVDKKDQRLIEEIDKVAGSVIIFVKTKWKTEKLAKFLANAGHDVARIHGDRSQTQRSGAIKDFREGRSRILVATDIAARGIDITHIAHVVNYDLPMSPEDYIHRIGRTARAGADGHSISFVTPGEMMLWARIHKLIHGRYPDEHPGRAFGRSGADANKPRGKQSEQENKRLDYRRAEGGFRGGKASTVKPSATTKPSAKQAMKPGPQSFNKPPLRQHRDKPSDGASKFAPPSPRRQNEKRAQEFLKNEFRSACAS
jgi:ATP-dependent RNA helicase DeaD